MRPSLDIGLAGGRSGSVSNRRSSAVVRQSHRGAERSPAGCNAPIDRDILESLSELIDDEHTQRRRQLRVRRPDLLVTAVFDQATGYRYIGVQRAAADGSGDYEQRQRSEAEDAPYSAKHGILSTGQHRN